MNARLNIRRLNFHIPCVFLCLTLFFFLMPWSISRIPWPFIISPLSPWPRSFSALFLSYHALVVYHPLDLFDFLSFSQYAFSVPLFFLCIPSVLLASLLFFLFLSASLRSLWCLSFFFLGRCIFLVCPWSRVFCVMSNRFQRALDLFGMPSLDHCSPSTLL